MRRWRGIAGVRSLRSLYGTGDRHQGVVVVVDAAVAGPEADRRGVQGDAGAASPGERRLGGGDPGAFADRPGAGAEGRRPGDLRLAADLRIPGRAVLADVPGAQGQRT